MAKTLLETLNIEKKEASPVFLLTLQSMFFGIFFGAFDVSANALFLETFESSMLPKAFMISGFAGIIITSIYSKLQEKLSFSKVSVINLIFIFCVTAALRITYFFIQSKWLIFAILVFMGPLTIIGSVGFWGVAGRMFTLRQGKRLFGLIDSGQIFGVILCSFTIPVFINFGIKTIDLLIICGVSILIALILQFLIQKRFDLEVHNVEETKEPVKGTKFTELFKEKYTRIMAIFVILSMVTAFFIHYNFLWVSDEKYPEPAELAKFFGVFTGTVMIFSFLFKTFIYSKIMKTYSLMIVLLILPVLLIFFTFLASIIGTFFGYETESTAFTFFFLIFALSRLFQKSFKDSIEAPSFKVLYQSLDIKIRYNVQARIDGTVNEISATSSGIILFLLSLSEIFKLIHYTYILLAIIVLYAYVTIKLYNEYRITLQRSLAHYKTRGHLVYDIRNYEISSYLSKEFSTDNPDKLIQIVNLAEKTDPILFDHFISNLLLQDKTELKRFALIKIDDWNLLNHLSTLDTFIENENIPQIIERAIDIKTRFETIINKKYSNQIIFNLINSPVIADRVLVAKLIPLLNERNFYPFLIPLLRDLNEEVVLEAIKSTSILKSTEYCNILIDFLSSPVYSKAASSALISMGESSVPYLEQNFYKAGIDKRVLINIVRIIGLIKSDKSTRFLIAMINHPYKEIVLQAIICLRLMDFKATNETKNIFKQATIRRISNIAWLYNVLVNIKNNNLDTYLRITIREEVKENFEELYLLLSLIYDAESITYIRENIDSDSAESIGYALELLDLFIDSDLKPVLFPIIEDISPAERVKRLEDHFPLQRLDGPQTINSIINKDYNNVNLWTKAYAIYSLSLVAEVEITNDIKAILFSPYPILHETAACLIHDREKEIFDSCIARINSTLTNNILKAIELRIEKDNHLLIEKVFFLRGIKRLSKVPAVVLIQIAEDLEEEIVEANQVIIHKNKINPYPIYFIIKGEVVLCDDTNTILKYSKNNIVGDMIILHSDHNSTRFETRKKTHLYRINQKKLYKNCFNSFELINAVSNLINDRFEVIK